MDQIAHAFSVPHFLAEEDNFGVFFLVTVLLGGGAAWLTGRAAAQTWRPAWQVVVYTLILGFAVRFIHFLPLPIRRFPQASAPPPEARLSAAVSRCGAGTSRYQSSP